MTIWNMYVGFWSDVPTLVILCLVTMLFLKSRLEVFTLRATNVLMYFYADILYTKISSLGGDPLTEEDFKEFFDKQFT